MTIFRTPVPGIVIPAKAGIHCQCLNRSSLNFRLPFKCELWDYLGSKPVTLVPSKT
jgi:hypothetical protein